MPVIKLEYTDQIQVDSRALGSFFHQLHALLHDILAVDLQSCKSHAAKLTQYYVADGGDVAFVLLHVHLLKGRDIELIRQFQQRADERLFSFIKQHVVGVGIASIQQRIHIIEMDPAFYSMREYALSQSS